MMQGVQNQSAALNLFRRIPVAQSQTRFPVLSALPTAYFVSPTDTGLKQTTEANWTNKYMNIEEIAAIVPIPEAVLADTSFDMWGEMRPMLEEAIARTVDSAIFFGTNLPATWGTAIYNAATAAGNMGTLGTSGGTIGGLATDLSNILGTLELDGYDANTFVANTTLKATLRNARDANGVALSELTPASVWGVPVSYPMAGLWPAGTVAAAFALDRTRFLVGIRQDFTFKVITEGVITDDQGAIMYNLPQQDMAALRVVFRMGWVVSNPINYQQQTESSRYPAAVVVGT